jgi:surfactin synthase thioesterase subunit
MTVPLLCFPYAGGGAGVFRRWRTRDSAVFRIVPVQYPGREERFAEPFHRTLDEAAEDCARQVRQAVDGVPFAFFGHSFGALLAYRTARFLRMTGQPLPFHLIASGAAAPCVPRNPSGTPDADDADVLRRIAAFSGSLPVALRDPDLREVLLPAFRSDLRLHESHSPAIRDALPIPITTLRGEADSLVTAPQAMRWAEATTRVHRFVCMPGGHMYLTDDWERFWRVVEAALAAPRYQELP